MIHTLKILPEYFKEVLSGNKTFELRKDDRDYKVEDLLRLKEWDGSSFTGNNVVTEVTYILKDCSRYGLKKGFVIIGMK
jgi:hypothetical protein